MISVRKMSLCGTMHGNFGGINAFTPHWVCPCLGGEFLPQSSVIPPQVAKIQEGTLFTTWFVHSVYFGSLWIHLRAGCFGCWGGKWTARSLQSTAKDPRLPRPRLGRWLVHWRVPHQVRSHRGHEHAPRQRGVSTRRSWRAETLHPRQNERHRQSVLSSCSHHWQRHGRSTFCTMYYLHRLQHL